jgi:hypothetical protein
MPDPEFYFGGGLRDSLRILGLLLFYEIEIFLSLLNEEQ